MTDVKNNNLTIVLIKRDTPVQNLLCYSNHYSYKEKAQASLSLYIMSIRHLLLCFCTLNSSILLDVVVSTLFLEGVNVKILSLRKPQS